jgi:hypothetical protein
MMFIFRLGAGSRGVELLGKFHKRRIETSATAQRIDGFEASSGNEPAAWIAGHAIALPLFNGREKGFVERFLGEFEVAKQTNECSEDAARVGAVDVVDNRANAFSRDRVLDHKAL